MTEAELEAKIVKLASLYGATGQVDIKVGYDAICRAETPDDVLAETNYCANRGKMLENLLRDLRVNAARFARAILKEVGE